MKQEEVRNILSNYNDLLEAVMRVCGTGLKWMRENEYAYKDLIEVKLKELAKNKDYRKIIKDEYEFVYPSIWSISGFHWININDIHAIEFCIDRDDCIDIITYKGKGGYYEGEFRVEKEKTTFELYWLNNHEEIILSRINNYIENLEQRVITKIAEQEQKKAQIALEQKAAAKKLEQSKKRQYEKLKKEFESK